MGAPAMQAALPVMGRITEMFTAIGRLAGANPESVKFIAEILTAFGAAFIVLGAIALGAVVASLVGIPALIAAAVAALGTLAFFEWDRLRVGVMGVVADFGALRDSFVGFTSGHMDILRVAQALGVVAKYFSGPAGLIGFLMHTETIHNAMIGIADAFRKEIMALPGMVAGSITSAVSGIASSFGAALNHVFSGHGAIGDPGGGVTPIPQSYPSTGSPGSMMQKANWMPPGRWSQPIQFTAALNLDSRPLSEVVAQRIAEMDTHATQAPYFNGQNLFTRQDAQIQGT